MIQNTMSLSKFTKLIYGYEFFNSFLVIYPLYAIMFQNNGMNDTQISLLLIFWSVSVLVFQAPVSFFCNRYFSYKSMVIYGQFLKALCFYVWIAWPNFWGYLLGFALWGIQWSIYNTAFEALVYEELKARNKQSLYVKICGRKHAANTVGYLLSGLGSFLISLGYEMITYISIATTILGSLLIVFIPPLPKIQDSNTTNKWEYITESIQIFKKAPQIMLAIILLTAIVDLIGIDEYFGLIGVQMGIPVKYVGLIFIATLLAQSLGSLSASKFEKVSDQALYTGTILIGLVFSLICYFYNFFGLLIMTACFFGFAVLRVLLFTRLQHATPSKDRALVLGVYSVFEQFTSIMSYIAMMIGAYLGGYKFGFLILGGSIMALGCGYCLLNKFYPPRKPVQKTQSNF